MTRLYRSSCEECQWSSRLCSSEGQADYSFRQHSCTKKRRRDAAHLRGVRRRSRIDRTPKPCLHKQASHEHGTYACYVLDLCRCRPCARANAEYERTRTRQAAYGRWQPYVDAAPAREHVRALMAAGVGLKRVVIVSGVAQGVLWKLVYGKRRADGSQVPSARVRAATAFALLALDPADPSLLAAGVRVDSTGARRRLGALVVCGWSVEQLAGESGIDRQRLDGALRGREVTLRTVQEVRDLYDRLWDVAPPESTHRERIAASRARRRGLEAGWAPPAAWDDDTIDDPAAAPAGVGACRAGRCEEPVLADDRCSRHYHQDRRGTKKTRRPAEDVLEDLEWLLDQGESPDMAALRLDVSVDSLTTAARRAGRDDLLKRLATSIGAAA